MNRGGRSGFAHRGGNQPHLRRVKSQSLDGFRPGKPTNGFGVEPWSPAIGFETEDTTPNVQFVGTSWDAGAMNFEIQFATDLDFLSIVGTATGTCSHNSLATVTAPVLPRRAIWWRVRTGRSGLWSAWSSNSRWFSVTQSSLVTIAYVDMNVGTYGPPLDAVAYVDLNVGVGDAPSAAPAYVDMNVGPYFDYLNHGSYVDLNVFPPIVAKAVATYLDVNQTNNVPVPHIWWIRPEWGKTGWVFHVFGHGFGNYKALYDGEVFVGAQLASTSEWQRFAATIEGAGRMIVQGPTENDEVITVEYEHIAVVVPGGLASGEHSVKVVLG